MSQKNTSPTRIGRFFTLITDRVYRAVAKGPVGRLFSSYSALNQRFRDSGTVALSNHKPTTGGRMLRRGMAQAMDQSFLRRACYAMIDGICRCSLRALGSFFLTTGLYAALTTWLVNVIWRAESPSGLLLFFALSCVVVGMPLLFSGSSVAYSLQNSAILGWLLRVPLGLSEDAIKDIPRKGKSEYLTVTLLGMLSGVLLALTGPLRLLFVLLLLAICLLLFATPEAGLVLLLAGVPFIGMLPEGNIWTITMAVLLLVSYACKLMRGTRAFRMEVQDAVVLLLLVTTLLGGVSAGGRNALPDALVSALLIGIYFPAVNILSTPHWLLRARSALLCSATVAALIGIFQFILSAVLSVQGGGEVDALLWGSSVRAGFADHAGFAYFMLLAFPLALYAFLRARGSMRLPTGFACVTIAAATVLSFVQSAWVVLAFEVVLLCLLYRRSTFPYFATGAVMAPATFFLLPGAWRRSFTALLRESTDLSPARFGESASFLGNVLFGGGNGFFGHGAGLLRLCFGLGNGGVEAVCVLYTVTPASEVIAGMNFWSYRLLEGGILGVLLPALLFFLLLQNSFSLLRGTAPGREWLAPLCSVTMISGAILFSIFRYTWLDPAALAIFFLLIAVMTADARHRRERGRVASKWGTQGERYVELEYQVKAAHKGDAKNSSKEGNDELQ